jgi:glutathione S-transferase
VYVSSVSNAARGVIHYLRQTGHTRDVSVVDVNMMASEHKSLEYRRIHPRHLVPALIDPNACADGADFVLNESAAIIKYIALKFKCPSYPADDPRTRAKVNEVMAFANTGLYTQLGYHLVRQAAPSLELSATPQLSPPLSL